MSVLASLLARDRIVPVETIEKAIQSQVVSGGSLQSILLEMGAIKENVMSAYVAATHGLLPATREEVMRVPRDLLRRVPVDMALEYRIVPIAEGAGTLVVASDMPPPAQANKRLELQLGCPVSFRIAAEVRIAAGLTHHYAAPIQPTLRRLSEALRNSPDGDVPYVAPPKSLSDAAQAHNAEVDMEWNEPSVTGMAAPPGNPNARMNPPTKQFGVPQLPLSRQPATRRRSGSSQEVLTQRRQRRTSTRSFRPLRAAMTLREATDALKQTSGRDEVLQVLMAFSRQYMNYVAIFVVQDDVASGRDAWGPGAAKEEVQRIALPMDVPGTFHLSQDGQPRVVDLRLSELDRILVRSLDRHAQQPALVLPIKLRERVVLLFYGDRGGMRFELSEVKDLIELSRFAGEAFFRILHTRRKEGRSASGAPSVPPSVLPTTSRRPITEPIAKTPPPRSNSERPPSIMVGVPDHAPDPGFKPRRAGVVSSQPYERPAKPTPNRRRSVPSPRHQPVKPELWEDEPDTKTQVSIVPAAPDTERTSIGPHDHLMAEANNMPDFTGDDGNTEKVAVPTGARTGITLPPPESLPPAHRPEAQNRSPEEVTSHGTPASKRDRSTTERSIPAQPRFPQVHAVPADARTTPEFTGTHRTPFGDRAADPEAPEHTKGTRLSVPTPAQPMPAVERITPLHPMSSAPSSPFNTPVDGTTTYSSSKPYTEQRQESPSNPLARIALDRVPASQAGQSKTPVPAPRPRAQPMNWGHGKVPSHPAHADRDQVTSGGTLLNMGVKDTLLTASPSGFMKEAEPADNHGPAIHSVGPDKDTILTAQDAVDLGIPQGMGFEVDLGEGIEEQVERLLAATPDTVDHIASGLASLGVAAAEAVMTHFPGPMWASPLTPAGEPLPLRADQVSAVCALLVRLGNACEKAVTPHITSDAHQHRYLACLVARDAKADVLSPHLAERLFDMNESVRSCALDALRSMNVYTRPYGVALEILRTRLVNARSIEERHRVVRILSELHDEGSLDLFLERLDDPAVGIAARQALVEMTCHDFGDDSQAWRSWIRANGDRHRVEWLIDALGQQNSQLVALAVRQLASRKDLTLDVNMERASPEDRARVQHRYRQWWETDGWKSC